MKGFIEVTESRNNSVLIIAVRSIDIIQDKKLILSETSVLRVNETCEEIKALIKEAQKEVTVNLPSVQTLPIRDYEGIITTSSASMDTEGNVVAVELAKTVGEKNEKEYMYECDCDFCEGGAIRFALKRGGHADEWFDYTRQLTVKDEIINVALVSEDGTEENVIFEGISFCPFCGRAFQENTKEDS